MSKPKLNPRVSCAHPRPFQDVVNGLTTSTMMPGKPLYSPGEVFQMAEVDKKLNRPTGKFIVLICTQVEELFDEKNNCPATVTHFVPYHETKN